MQVIGAQRSVRPAEHVELSSLEARHQERKPPSRLQGLPGASEFPRQVRNVFQHELIRHQVPVAALDSNSAETASVPPSSETDTLSPKLSSAFVLDAFR